jgi:predicted acylesterase/phospholipase RssA
MPYFADIENLVFQGGGVKGAAYISALEALLNQQQADYINLAQIKRVCGASAGAICAFLLAIGYNIQDLKHVLSKMKMEELLDEDEKFEHGFNTANTFVNLYEMYEKLVIIDKSVSSLDFSLYLFHQLVDSILFDWIAAKGKNVATKVIADKIEKQLKGLLEKFFEFIKSTAFYEKIQSWFALAATAIDKGNDFFFSVKKFLMQVIDYFDGEKFDSIQKIMTHYFDQSIKTKFSSPPGAPSYQDFIIAVTNVIITFFVKGSLFSGKCLLAWFQTRLKTKGLNTNITFKELHARAQEQQWPDLYLIAVNLTTGMTQIFSHKHTPNVIVAEAVRISMSIPYFFAPYQFTATHVNNENIGQYDLWADGGVHDNYPIWVFDSAEQYNNKTLGLRLVNKQTKEIIETASSTGNPVVRESSIKREYDTSFITYTRKLVETIFKKQESDFFHSPNVTRTVLIETGNVGTIEFGLPAEKQQQLQTLGQKGAEEFITYRNRYDYLKQQITSRLPGPGWKTTSMTAAGLYVCCKKYGLNTPLFTAGCVFTGVIAGYRAANFAVNQAKPYQFSGSSIARYEQQDSKNIAMSSGVLACFSGICITSLTYMVTGTHPCEKIGIDKDIANVAFIAGTTLFTIGYTYAASTYRNKKITSNLQGLPDCWRLQLGAVKK